MSVTLARTIVDFVRPKSGKNKNRRKVEENWMKVGKCRKVLNDAKCCGHFLKALCISFCILSAWNG